MDAWGDTEGTAMARLVSHPVSFAVKAISDNDTDHGVSAASSKSYLVDNWLEDLSSLAQEFDIIDHLAVNHEHQISKI